MTLIMDLFMTLSSCRLQAHHLCEGIERQYQCQGSLPQNMSMPLTRK
jgi:hypothetical protein